MAWNIEGIAKEFTSGFIRGEFPREGSKKELDRFEGEIYNLIDKIFPIHYLGNTTTRLSYDFGNMGTDRKGLIINCEHRTGSHKASKFSPKNYNKDNVNELSKKIFSDLREKTGYEFDIKKSSYSEVGETDTHYDIFLENSALIDPEYKILVRIKTEIKK